MDEEESIVETAFEISANGRVRPLIIRVTLTNQFGMWETKKWDLEIWCLSLEIYRFRKMECAENTTLRLSFHVDGFVGT
jgi:hypothetical protein